jgi:hypothetical protein
LRPKFRLINSTPGNLVAVVVEDAEDDCVVVVRLTLEVVELVPVVGTGN